MGVFNCHAEAGDSSIGFGDGLHHPAESFCPQQWCIGKSDNGNAISDAEQIAGDGNGVAGSLWQDAEQLFQVCCRALFPMLR